MRDAYQSAYRNKTQSSIRVTDMTQVKYSKLGSSSKIKEHKKNNIVLPLERHSQEGKLVHRSLQVISGKMRIDRAVRGQGEAFRECIETGQGALPSVSLSFSLLFF
jgi:hypothetical protein